MLVDSSPLAYSSQTCQNRSSYNVTINYDLEKAKLEKADAVFLARYSELLQQFMKIIDSHFKCALSRLTYHTPALVPANTPRAKTLHYPL